MRKNASITREQNEALYQELLASPVARDELLMANPYHKGYDSAVQAARMKTSRSIDLSGAVGRADKERKS